MWKPWRKATTKAETGGETYDVEDPPPAPRVTVAPAPPYSPPLKLRPAGYVLGESESRVKRGLFHLVALAITVGYFYFLLCFWAPAPGRPGIDENAYLVAGKMIADHGSGALVTSHPLQYVGAMWVKSARTGSFYPKYPAGISLIYAVPFWLTRRLAAKEAAFLVSPACAALAAYGVFLLARRVAGSFHAVLAMIVLATGITTLELSLLSNSHLPCLCVVTWGMYFLVRCVQSGRARWGVVGAFLLGYAVSIRYSQGLMALPVGAAVIALVLQRWRLKGTSRVLAPLSLVLAWAIPVAALAAYNWLTVGHLSGYDATRESTGFTLKEFLRKWEFGADQVYHFGLFFIAPLGLIGLVLMFRRQRAVATLLALWFVPGTLLYMAYYWGQQAPGTGFLRFYLDLFPALVVAAFWMVRMAGRAATLESPRTGSVAVPLAAGLLCAIPSAHGLWISVPEMARQHVGNLNLSYSAKRFLARVPSANQRTTAKTPVVFCDEGLFPQLLMYLQFMGDADWYAADAFIPRFGGGFGLLGFKRAEKDDSPVLIQEERRDAMDQYYKAHSAKDLVAEQHKVMDEALAKGREVYLLLNAGQVDDFRKTFITPPYRADLVEKWTEPAGNPADPPNHPMSPGHWRLNLVINWNPQVRHLLRVTHEQ